MIGVFQANRLMAVESGCALFDEHLIEFRHGLWSKMLVLINYGNK
jgi:hypothetical protein